MSEADFVWVPSEETKRQSQLGAFLARHGLADYQALHARAADDPDWFWNAVIRFFDIQFEQQYERVLDLSAGIPWARWCVGGRTNLVLSSLDAHMTTSVEPRLVVPFSAVRFMIPSRAIA